MCASAVTAKKQHRGEKQGQIILSPIQKLGKDQWLSLEGETVLRVEGEGRTKTSLVLSLK